MSTEPLHEEIKEEDACFAQKINLNKIKLSLFHQIAISLLGLTRNDRSDPRRGCVGEGTSIKNSKEFLDLCLDSRICDESLMSIDDEIHRSRILNRFG
jgi:hypothetical protein